MNFDVAEAVPLGELRPGDRIRFRLERSGSALRIASVEVIGKGEPPEGSGGVAAAPAELEPAPAFELIDQDGRRFSLGELHGSAVLLDFIFTRCAGPCPLLTARQVELQRALDPALRACTRFVSISVDPEYDQPDVLRAYARAHGADLRDWWFLTGETPAVDAALAAYGVGAVRTDARNLEHSVATYLIDPQGRIVHRYLGLGADRAELERDLRAACDG
jgi:protein SCO1/2